MIRLVDVADPNFDNRSVDALIREQIEYYDARASEYDRTATPPGDVLAPFGRAQIDALHRFRPVGETLYWADGRRA